LAAVARDLPGFRRDRPGDTFRGWLRVVTRSKVLLYVRRNEGQAVAEGGSDALDRLQNVTDPPPAEGEDELDQMNGIYRKAVMLVRCEFEESTWRAFWLTAIEERSPDALIDELGMNPPAIRKAKSRVLRRLKEELGELLETEP
jgi:RNA polymerase sigma-70 factor (ECF subfamily)